MESTVSVSLVQLPGTVFHLICTMLLNADSDALKTADERTFRSRSSM